MIKQLKKTNPIEKLEKTVVSIWGDKGKVWLKQLPELIKHLSQHWNLSNITPVDNMSYNYVAKATQNHNIPVVLKISCDKKLIEDECRTLKHFNGRGAIKVLDIYHDLHALLLEQAIPGNLLKQHYSNHIESTLEIYAKVVTALFSQTKPSDQYIHVSRWCKVIDNIRDPRIDTSYIDKAKELKEFLLSSAEKETLCHGDLHFENIICHNDQWLSIDPKGIIGEMAFEAAAFDLINKDEWSEPKSIQNKIIDRVSFVASKLDLDKYRLLAWIFLRVMISIQWFIEDSGNPDNMRRLASTLYPLLKK